MRFAALALIGLLAVGAARPALAAPGCAAGDGAIGVERIVEVETGNGPLFGLLTRQDKEPTFLRDKEVVLTFDDGPSPWVTPKILDALERHCTRATFFAVGKMAVAYPDVAREIIARGHTLGGHTWSHPRQLPRMSAARAHDEIERGFAALEAATGGGIAPFFRFTGLNDSAPLLGYLQRRGIASFTVDVVSDDSFISSPDELVETTLKRTEQRGGGILLFHDIKPTTAQALPAILDGLAARGFRIVHLRHAAPVTADAELVAGYRGRVAEKLAESRRPPHLIPFYGAIAAIRDDSGRPLATAKDAAPVSRLAPPPRDRTAGDAEPTSSASHTKTKRKPPKSVRETNPPAGASRRAAPPPEDETLPWKSDMTTGALGPDPEPVSDRGPGPAMIAPPLPSVRATP